MPHEISVSHTFETSHRLPQLPGKCISVHGHSWHTEITVTAPALANGLVVEFGPFKNALRGWIDKHLDHGIMLGPDDPLAPVLRDVIPDQKIHLVPGWPTVENVAAMLANMAEDYLMETQPRAPHAYISRVHVQETSVNAATWTASPSLEDSTLDAINEAFKGGRT